MIACDTDVVLDGRALGKPADAAEARRVPGALSGRAHEVLSGLVVLADGEERVGPASGRRSVFRQLGEAREGALRRASGSGAAVLVATRSRPSARPWSTRIEGSVSNVVGLPVGLLFELAPELFRSP